jgi:hypothetical protein
MVTKKINEAKFTAWTTTGMKIDMTGNIPGCALELFGYIHGAGNREKILKLMQERHEKLKEQGV